MLNRIQFYQTVFEIFVKFRQILMSRFEKIVVSIHCLLKVFKTSRLTFSLSTHAQHLCALGLRDMTKATKTEYISTENLWQFSSACTRIFSRKSHWLHM